MVDDVLQALGQQVREARTGRGLSQADVATRLGRDRARVSELERDLLDGRAGRDRLTLLAEVCDAFGLVPVLLPRAKADAVRFEGQEATRPPLPSGPLRTVWEEVFVDLSGDEPVPPTSLPHG